MSTLMHPHDIVRRYVIASRDGGVGWDETYNLVFTGGELVVRVIRDFTQDYKTPSVQKIEPEDFSTVEINGVKLRDLVLKTLSAILPDSD